MRAMSQDGRSARAKNIYDEAHKNLVNSAIKLFNNPDIPNEKINLTLIAKEAGTSVATAYNHFPENLIDVFGSIFNIAFEKIVEAVLVTSILLKLTNNRSRREIFVNIRWQ